MEDAAAAAAVLAEVERIIEHEHAEQGATAHLKDMFNLQDRQATMALHQIRANFARAAHRAGMTFDEYVDALTLAGKMAIFGFCVGAVQQQDLDLGVDPVTGEKRRPPAQDYNI